MGRATFACRWFWSATAVWGRRRTRYIVVDRDRPAGRSRHLDCCAMRAGRQGGDGPTSRWLPAAAISGAGGPAQWRGADPGQYRTRLATRDLMQHLCSADPFRQGGGAAFGRVGRVRFLQPLARVMAGAGAGGG